jgi:DNA-binding NtrC family response regulator
MAMKKQKSILLIEEDNNLRQSFALMLERAGYLVTATNCIQTAIDIVHLGEFHLIISEINMVETENILIPYMVEYYPHTSIIILSDQPISTTDEKKKVFTIHYLEKLIAPEYLLDFVHAVLDKRVRSDRRADFNMSKNYNKPDQLNSIKSEHLEEAYPE